MDDIGKLEEAMANAVVMLIFLSSGYFASHNCRREVYAALTNNKPIEAMIVTHKQQFDHSDQQRAVPDKHRSVSQEVRSRVTGVRTVSCHCRIIRRCV